MGYDSHLQIYDEDLLNKRTTFLSTTVFLQPSIMDIIERMSAWGRKMTQISSDCLIWGISS